jgi:hypothetical protein
MPCRAPAAAPSAAERRPSPLRGAVLALLAVLVCVVAVIAPTAPASAVDAIRTRLPIVAGTELDFPTGYCTAGLVVVRTGLLANITPRQRATRYVLTAKHCGRMGDPVSVGGREVGQVSWVDPVEDLELVRIDPTSHGQPFCSPTSQGFHCTGTPTYDPAASGRVVLTTLQSRALSAIPVTGTGAPADGEVFCVSGKSSGQSCEFTSAPWRSEIGPRTPGQALATGGTLILNGDSGGPVVSSRGRIYGVVESTATGTLHSALIYVRVSQFFADAGGYGLAPA